MIVLKGIGSKPGRFSRLVLTIGVFDGVHLGHRKILSSVVHAARAIKGTAAALTFDGHPKDVVSPAFSPPLLATLEQKLRQMEGAGLDVVMLARFDRAFAGLAPEKFVEEILVRRLRIRELVVGYDFVFGRQGLGNHGLLRRAAREHGFGLKIVPPVDVEGIPVSSTRIRSAILAGDMELAGKLLGRPYTVSGRVVRGFGRGRKLGFPTANLKTGQELLPKPGVWGGKARLDGRRQPFRPFVAALGSRPTFERRGQPVLEIHLLDFEGELYGRRVEARFERYLRPERKFESARALAEQIRKDEGVFRKWMGRNK